MSVAAFSVALASAVFIFACDPTSVTDAELLPVTVVPDADTIDKVPLVTFIRTRTVSPTV